MTPSTILRARSTSPPKSLWPGVSTMLILMLWYRMPVILARMVMPRSRSRSLESMTRSTCSSWAPKMPLWLSMASTRVVLPWSTWAMMAMLRIDVLLIFMNWSLDLRLGRISGSGLRGGLASSLSRVGLRPEPRQKGPSVGRTIAFCGPSCRWRCCETDDAKRSSVPPLMLLARGRFPVDFELVDACGGIAVLRRHGDLQLHVARNHRFDLVRTDVVGVVGDGDYVREFPAVGADVDLESARVPVAGLAAGAGMLHNEAVHLEIRPQVHLQPLGAFERAPFIAGAAIHAAVEGVSGDFVFVTRRAGGGWFLQGQIRLGLGERESGAHGECQKGCFENRHRENFPGRL